MPDDHPEPSSDSKLKDEHSPQAIQKRLQEGPRHSYLRDFIYGAIDGTVTTYAIVAGVEGAGLSAGIIVILGLANLLGDGFSMAVGNYLSTRAEDQRRQRLRRIEKEHIARYPHGEREEIRQLFAAKGFQGEDLERVVRVITSDVERWVDTMLTDELGLALTGPSPLRAAWTTFFSFVLIGALPLVTFIHQLVAPPSWKLAHPFFWGSVVTAVVFYVIGALKSSFLGERTWLSGLETLFMGSAAAGIAYAIGALLKSVVVMS